MLKNILKWTSLVLGSLVVLLLLFYLLVYVKTQARINKVYAVKVQPIVVPHDSVSYVRGKHIAQNRGCMGCHGDNLAGGRPFLDSASPVGLLYSANITSGRGGLHFTQDDWVRVLRHGLTPENRSVWFMPSHDVYQISNRDLGELVSYVTAQPPVDNVVPAKSLKPLGRMLTFFQQYPLLPAEMIDHNYVNHEEVTPSVSAAYGGYLATVCRGCHGMTLKGGPAHEANAPDAPDISSTGHPAKWTDGEFIAAIRTGRRPQGKVLSDAMPWKVFTYTDDELKAIHLYLESAK